MDLVVSRRRFDAAAQRRFAAFSGDRNPLHTDPVAARRMLPGSGVVHGVHAVLWALDALAAHGLPIHGVRSIDVAFRRFLYVGAEVELRVVERGDGALAAALFADGLLATSIALTLGGKAPDVPALLGEQTTELPSEPASRSAAELRELHGILRPKTPQTGSGFAHLKNAVGPERVAALAQLSAVVGMLAPGRNAIFRDVAVALCGRPATRGLSFAVRRVDERFGLVELALAGEGLVGTASAFDAPGPVAAPSIAGMRGKVTAGAFAGTTALVIGGSRGIGAATALALGAGGGRVAITYAVGETDAAAVAAQIGPDAACVFRYDARADAAAQLNALTWTVDQVYYFASPPIFRQKADGFDPRRFRELCDVYVEGFARLCAAVRARGAPQMRVFYPSTTALDERPPNMLEYAMAKAAGEILCDEIDRSGAGMRVLVRRLPRVATDQTATVIPAAAISAADAVLPILRAMHEPEPAPAARERRS